MLRQLCNDVSGTVLIENNCAVPFEFLLVGRQTSRESGEIPPDRRPVRVCMMDKMDQLKSESGQPWRSLLKENILNFPGNQISSINH